MPVRLFACWCARATRRKSHRLLLRTSRRRGECHKGLRGSGEEKCLRVAHFRALLCDVHEDQSRVYRRMCRLSLSGWMRSVPYPFRSQMAKVERENPFGNCPKRGLSNVPTIDSAGIRRAKWVEKSLIGGPCGYAMGAPEAFRTVSRSSTLAIHAA